MQPVHVSTTVGKPREEVFAYLADIANHPEFTDHFLKQWHLTRIDSVGRGAGARFRIDAPRRRFSWADLTFVEVLPPHRIVGMGRGGKFNRVKTTTIWELSPAAGGSTRVEMSTETEPQLLTDRIFNPLGSRGWIKRKSSRALRRLRRILEENDGRGERATVGGL